MDSEELAIRRRDLAIARDTVETLHDIRALLEYMARTAVVRMQKEVA